MTEREISLLLKKYNNGQASPHEQALLEHWYHDRLSKQGFSDDNLDIHKLKAEIWKGTKQKSKLAENKSAISKSRETHRTQVRRSPIRLSYPLAAAVAVVLGIGAYLYFNSGEMFQTYTVADLNNQGIDIKPGSNQATLTLADGRVINLSDDKDGIIINADALTYTDGTEITGNNVGGLSNPEITDKITYNTITTPKGGQYRIVLPDGSRVWLNAASILKYPSRFDRRERRVELTGEAYFEIAQIKSVDRKTSKPFIVKSSTQNVEVLGTHFNINTYEDEPAAVTTLLEGSVNVLSGNENEAMKLVPGQQSIVQPGMKTKVLAADLDKSIGWKNGEFIFYNESIEKVMKDIARWYDIEVIYNDPVQKKKMWGSVSKFENISKVLTMIELTGAVHFNLQIQGDDRRVYVMN